MATHGALAHRFTDGIYDEGLAQVLRGLLYIPRQLSHTWLYDERGCRLFEKICEQPEYYLTRVESAILRAAVGQMAALLDGELAVIEFGSGNSGKIRPLLERLPRLRNYVPIDIAVSSLARAARALRRDFPAIGVLPLCTDFTRPLQLPAGIDAGTRRLVYLAGSTLGNYERRDAIRLLASMRALAGDCGLALIGIDLVKDPALLLRAYDDARGVTAEFNLNALRHLNRRLGLGLEISRFRHRAVWLPDAQRIEMHLVSTADQAVRVGAAVIRIERGDFIRTECCHKYTATGFELLAAEAGWRACASWTDAQQRFSVQLLEPA